MKKIDLFAEVVTEISHELGKRVVLHIENGNRTGAYMAYGGLVALHDLAAVIHECLKETN